MQRKLPSADFAELIADWHDDVTAAPPTADIESRRVDRPLATGRVHRAASLLQAAGWDEILAARVEAGGLLFLLLRSRCGGRRDGRRWHRRLGGHGATGGRLGRALTAQGGGEFGHAALHVRDQGRQPDVAVGIGVRLAQAFEQSPGEQAVADLQRALVVLVGCSRSRDARADRAPAARRSGCRRAPGFSPSASAAGCGR